MGDDHGHRHDERHHGKPGGQFVLALAQDDEPQHHDHGQRHAPDELLGDAGGDVAETIEDALPVLKMQESADAADHEAHRRGDKTRHLKVAAATLKGQDAHAPQQAAGDADEQREDYEGPLRFH